MRWRSLLDGCSRDCATDSSTVGNEEGRRGGISFGNIELCRQIYSIQSSTSASEMKTLSFVAAIGAAAFIPCMAMEAEMGNLNHHGSAHPLGFKHSGVLTSVNKRILNGALNGPDLMKMVETQYPFDKADDDDDGFVHEEEKLIEMLKATKPGPLDGDFSNKPAILFHLDKNNDGAIDAQEYTLMLVRRFERNNPKIVEQARKEDEEEDRNRMPAHTEL